MARNAKTLKICLVYLTLSNRPKANRMPKPPNIFILPVSATKKCLKYSVTIAIENIKIAVSSVLRNPS